MRHAGGNFYIENVIVQEVTKVKNHTIEYLVYISSEGHDLRKYGIEFEENVQVEYDSKVGDDVDGVDSEKEKIIK